MHSIGVEAASSQGEHVFDRSAEVLAWRGRVQALLVEKGFVAMAGAWAGCYANCYHSPEGGDLPEFVDYVACCSADPAHFAMAVPVTCGNRFCPECGARQQAKMMLRYEKGIAALVAKCKSDESLKMMTLTTKISGYDPLIGEKADKGFDCIVKLFEALFGQGWRKKVGYVASCEIGGNGLLHYHLVVLSPFIDNRLLSELWAKFSPDGSFIVDVRAKAYSHSPVEKVRSAINYAMKYATKMVKLDGGGVSYPDPALVVHLMLQFRNMRRVRSYGLFFNMPDEIEAAACPECGAAIVKFTRSEWLWWCETGFLPAEQRFVLRGDLLLNLKEGNKYANGADFARADDRVFIQLPLFKASVISNLL